MSTTARDVAMHIVRTCSDEGRPISNLQLQKILYFCQERSYRDVGRPLFGDDFEAWRYGPVVPDVYRLFSLFGGEKIRRKVEDRYLEDYERAIVDAVAREKRQMQPWDLVAETHRPGSPWAKTYDGGAGNGRVIPKRLIRESALRL